MSEFYGWKDKVTGKILQPGSSPARSVDELFANCGYGLPVRELERHRPVRIVKDVKGMWIEKAQDEKDRIWDEIVRSSST